MSRQLPFELTFRPALGREDFFIAPCNEDAVAWLDSWPDWPAPALILHGPPGSGKTHLASVFAAQSDAHEVAPEDADAAPDQIFAEYRTLLIENADDWIAGGRGTCLLHLYNLARDLDRHLLLTARTSASQWDARPQDLASRLRAAPSARIGPPDGALLEMVLAKLFADRRVRVGKGVLSYLVTRMERSFDSARILVNAVDSASLAEQRRITIPLVREVLREQGLST